MTEEMPLTVTLIVAGAARTGKSAFLRAVQERLQPREGATAASISTPALLDWLPVPLGPIGGREVVLHLYVVPAPGSADATRRLVLAEAAGVVFVADAQAHRLDDNLAAMADLWAGLGDVSEHPRRVPMVIFYSKHDLPADLVLGRSALDDLINFAGVPSFAGDALRGDGVLEALQAVIGPALRRLARPGAVAAG